MSTGKGCCVTSLSSKPAHFKRGRDGDHLGVLVHSRAGRRPGVPHCEPAPRGFPSRVARRLGEGPHHAGGQGCPIRSPLQEPLTVPSHTQTLRNVGNHLSFASSSSRACRRTLTPPPGYPLPHPAPGKNVLRRQSPPPCPLLSYQGPLILESS